MIIGCAALLSLLSAPAQATTAPAAPSTLHVSVAGRDWTPSPYDPARGLILVHIMLNGQPAIALIDNGAQRTLIDQRVAKKLGVRLSAWPLRTVGTNGDSLPSQRADGVTLEIPHMLSIGGSTPAIDLAVMETEFGQPISAVIGGDVLDRLAISVQPVKRQVGIGASGSFTPGTGNVVLPLLDGAVVTAAINSQTVRLKVDLGSNGAVKLTDEAWRRLIPAGADTVKGTSTAIGGSTGPERAALADVRLGQVTAHGVPAISGYGLHDADGLLGNDFLSHVEIILDAPRHQLILVPLRPNPVAPPAR